MQSHQSFESKSEISPFDLIYQAAKEKNEQRLAQILFLNSIDVFDKKYASSPIARFATENDITSVIFLANHGASLDWAAYGFARGRHTAEAFNVLDNVKRNQPDQVRFILYGIASGFAISGYKNEAVAFLNLIMREYPIHMASILNYMADGFAKSIHKQDAYAFLEEVTNKYPAYHISVLKEIVLSEHQAGTCTDQAVVLKTLALIDDNNARSQLALELKDSILAYDTLNLASKASRFNQRMKKVDITYNQLLGWIQPEMQIFLLQGISLVHKGKLSSSTFLYIATFLSPMTLTETLDLSNKLALSTCPARLFKTLKQHGALLLAYKPLERLTQDADRKKDAKLASATKKR